MKYASLFSLRTMLALAAGSVLTTPFVLGTEPGHETPDGIAEAVKPQRANPVSADIAPAPTADLDISRLHRTRIARTENGLFGVALPPPPPPPPPVAVRPVVEEPPPKPVAPPLPFKFLGRLIDRDQVVVFVAQNRQNLSLHQGDTIDNLYRVEAVDDKHMIFVYLPLNERQTMNIGRPN